MSPPVPDTSTDENVQELPARYGDRVTCRDWPAVGALFLPDCTLRLDLRDQVIERSGADDIVSFVSGGVNRFEFFLFSILNSVVDVDGDAATGRVHIREFRVDGDGRESTAFGLYRDRYQRTADGWRFAARDYTTLARSAADGGLEVFPVPGDL